MKVRRSEKNSPPAGRTIAAAAAELGIPPGAINELIGEMILGPADLLEAGEDGPLLTPAGFEKIRQAIEETMKIELAARAGTAAAELPVAAPGLVREDLRLARIFRGSPRVLAERANGLEVVLQVKTAELLEVGMTLKGCEQGEMCWFYTGRLPRTTGERQLYFPERADPISSHE